MKILAIQLFLFLATVFGLQGGISSTLLIPQPIVSFGDTDWSLSGSTDESYVILLKPFYAHHFNGPIYTVIADENIMDGLGRDCNLLSIYNIKIDQEFMSKNVTLNLSKATPEEDSSSALEFAGYAGLECIRMVANRHHHDIALKILAPKSQEEKWLAIQKEFADHDKSKPFTRKEQGGTGQPATRHESKSEGGDKPQPEAEGRSR